MDHLSTKLIGKDSVLLLAYQEKQRQLVRSPNLLDKHKHPSRIEVNYLHKIPLRSYQVRLLQYYPAGAKHFQRVYDL